MNAATAARLVLFTIAVAFRSRQRLPPALPPLSAKSTSHPGLTEAMSMGLMNEVKRGENLLDRVRACRACENDLPLGPRPIVQAHPAARLLIVGQAPGLKVHQTGIPWNDASGDRLRAWLDLSRDEFYDPKLVAVVPIGFCYPGRAKSGDLPPRKECFELWHGDLQSFLRNVRLTLLVGHHAQDRYLKGRARATATETIRDWRGYLPAYVPLPHPSPRNNIWLRKNPWFERTAIPEIRAAVKAIIG